MRAADLTLRPAQVSDAAFVADLHTLLRPDEPQDPEELTHAWATPEATRIVERFIAEAGGQRVGHAQQRHWRWELTADRSGDLRGDLLPAWRTPARLDALLACAEERALADGAQRLTAWAWEDDALRLGVLAARGYTEERRERYWELDLVAQRAHLERLTAESRERMRGAGIAILTIDRDPDPEKWQKLWRTSEEADHDVPSTIPHVENTFEDFMTWMRAPGLSDDRIWIAREGDAILGVSMLSYPRVRGVVQTDWTGMARAARGRGIARALKCETVMQAIALGVERVRTDNDSTNAPILHLNEVMGYRRRADQLQLMRAAR